MEYASNRKLNWNFWAVGVFVWNTQGFAIITDAAISKFVHQFTFLRNLYSILENMSRIRIFAYSLYFIFIIFVNEFCIHSINSFSLIFFNKIKLIFIYIKVWFVFYQLIFRYISQNSRWFKIWQTLRGLKVRGLKEYSICY